MGAMIQKHRRTSRMRTSALIAACIVAAALLWAAPSFAATGVWWHISANPYPTHMTAGGSGLLVVSATNRGYERADGSSSPVTLTASLPPGLEATEVQGVAGWATLFGVFGLVECTLSPLRCTFNETLLPYARIWMVISVKVASNASTLEPAEVTVGGGGGAPVSIKHSVVADGGAYEYGVDQSTISAEGERGEPVTQAGSHPFQMTTTVIFNKPNSVEWPPEFGEKRAGLVQPKLPKDLNVKLPPGLVGNPTPFPQCTTAQFTNINTLTQVNACPQDTAVGVAAITMNDPVLGQFTLPEPIFNLVPNYGEPARFGFVFFDVPVYLDTSVRTGGDYGVTVHVSDISELTEFVESEVTLWGVPGDRRHDTSRGWYCGATLQGVFGYGQCNLQEQQHPQPLLSMPTSCTGPLQASVETDSWQDRGKFLVTSLSEAMPALDGCNRLGFEPQVKVAPDTQAGSSPSGLGVNIHVPQDAGLNPSGLAESNVKDTVVALPAGVAMNPAAADGLESCSEAQIGLSNALLPSCPEAAKIGTLSIKTPLLPNALTGAAYLAAQTENPFGSLVAMYLVAYDPVSGSLVKIAGEVKPDPVTGQLTATFSNTPQLPFEDFELHFFGGSRAPLGTPSACGSYTTTTSIAPWSGNPASTPSSTFQVTSGPNGSPCASPLPFGPDLAAGSTNIQAGAFTPFTMTMSRPDGQQNLDAIKLQMPPGLLGEISKVVLCGEAQANAGTCGPESLIGETIVSVGLGGSPFSVKGGKVYITGPYKGAPYGLSIVNPAKAGPFDLGQVVVRAKIEVDPTTAAITITSDSTGPYAIPQIIDGIPLQIQHVNVTINRPEFTFNPTNCEPMQIGGSLTSTEGTLSGLHVPFQVTNCATLGFKPIFSASTQGKTSRAKGASLHVKLTYPKAPFGSQANIAYVKVALPKQLPSRLSTLQKACADSTFEANPAACPAESRVGTASATTPVLPGVLQGPAYFVSHGGQKFPELVIALSGGGVTVYLHGETFISKTGITSSTFRTIPDVPIGTFELSLPQGPYSALAANGNLCTSQLRMPTAFHAQNGMQIKQTTRITPTGCAKHLHGKHKNHKKHKPRKKHRRK
jgi:hypothetical protein